MDKPCWDFGKSYVRRSRSYADYKSFLNCYYCLSLKLSRAKASETLLPKALRRLALWSDRICEMEGSPEASFT